MLASTGWIAQALAAQYLPLDVLRRLQARRLRRIVRYAFANVPFYRELWTRARVDVDQIETVDDLRRLPIPNRGAIEHSQEDMISRLHLDALRGGTAIGRKSG